MKIEMEYNSGYENGFSESLKEGAVQCSYNQRIVLLDVLRVSMALLIYLFHSMSFQCSYGFLDSLVSVGAFVMTGFFMLSGYALRVVYGERNLMDKNELKRFYMKRMLGVLPVYYIIAILYIVFLGKETFVENLMLLPIETLGIQTTFYWRSCMTHNGGTWFISCLLLGYLIYPLLQTVLKQLTTRLKILLMVLLIGIELWAVLIKNMFHTASLYGNPFYRILEFAVGLLVADVNMTAHGKLLNTLRSWGALIVTSGVMLIGVSVVNYIFQINDYMILNWIVLPCFVIMLFALGSKRVKWLEKSRLLSYASKISYAFYLTQFFVWPIGSWFVELIGYNHNWIRILLTFSLCVGFSVLVYEIVQKRMVGFLRKALSL